jgi:hypothetical protein
MPRQDTDAEAHGEFSRRDSVGWDRDRCPAAVRRPA